MQLVADTVSASPADSERDDLAYVYVRAKGGYVISLARQPGAQQIELMVRDQVNFQTQDVAAVLTTDSLTVRLSTEAARSLDGHEIYEVRLLGSVQEVNAALKVVFERVGSYAVQL